jgi:hypothetical protein
LAKETPIAMDTDEGNSYTSSGSALISAGTGDSTSTSASASFGGGGGGSKKATDDLNVSVGVLKKEISVRSRVLQAAKEEEERARRVRHRRGTRSTYLFLRNTYK